MWLLISPSHRQLNWPESLLNSSGGLKVSLSCPYSLYYALEEGNPVNLFCFRDFLKPLRYFLNLRYFPIRMGCFTSSWHIWLLHPLSYILYFNELPSMIEGLILKGNQMVSWCPIIAIKMLMTSHRSKVAPEKSESEEGVEYKEAKQI